MKKLRRIIARNTLGDLEQQVRFLQASPERWDLDREADAPTIVEALDAVTAKKMVTVCMVRNVAEEIAS